jgi:ABC-2 type transport system ATP-binding protein
MTNGIEISEISHSFGQKRVLDQITLTIKGGTFCALLGPNGAGKSTLFSALTRLLIPTQGAIKIQGNDIHKNPRPALSNLGVVFQQQTMDLDLTVFQNLRYFGKLQGMSGKDLSQRIDQVLTLLNMAERSHEVVRTLNGGHRRRAEIARSLIHDPKVLLLDEATVGLDPETRKSITDDMHKIAQTGGKTILWATHLCDEVDDDDQLVILHNGKILRNGQAHEIANGGNLLNVFLSLTGRDQA